MTSAAILQLLLSLNMLVLAAISAIWYKIGKMESRLHSHIDNHHHQEVPPDGRTPAPD